MSREIRKVPKDWEHPRDARGRYQPMFAEAFADVLTTWQKNNDKWEKGIHPDQRRSAAARACSSYSEWAGDAPDPLYYNPNKWTEKEACCYQFYETVSEGTPLSRVFETLKELGAWLVKEQGYSQEDADDLCKTRWQPTFIGTVKKEPGALDMPAERKYSTPFNRDRKTAKKRKKKGPGR